LDPILAAAETTKPVGWARHFEGWQPGLLAVLLAVVVALVAVPRRVDPSDLPLPLIDSGALRAALTRDRTLADQIAPALQKEIADPTSGNALFDLRAFGQEFRAYGTAEATAEMPVVLQARQRMLRAIPAARAVGDEKLLALRAYQQRIFFSELTKWETTGQESPELVEIAGPFVRMISRHGWSDERGRLAMSESLRAVFFKRRWAEVTALTDPPFGLSLPETRALFAFLLSHPWVDREVAIDPKAACLFADQWRLRKIEELSRLDPAYPRLLARGVLLFRVGDYPAAAQTFRDYIATANEPPYVLRARNYLIAANAKAEQSP
jgi:hypothetical protein